MITQRTLNLSKLVVFDGYHGSSRYERFQRLLVVKTPTVTLPFHGTDLAGGGGLRTLVGTYSLLVDGVVKAKTTPIGTSGSFALDLTGIADGWRILDIQCPDPTESVPLWPIFVNRSGTATASSMPVWTGSFGITHPIGGEPGTSSTSTQSLAWVPSNYAVTPRPLPVRPLPTFATPDSPLTMFRANLVPITFGDVHRQNITSDGVVNTANRQAYFYGDTAPLPSATPYGAFISKLPAMALLDGARGIGTALMATHLEPGGTKGGIWFCDPWRFGHINADGKITTMIGYRHKNPAQHWEELPIPDLLGDWSAFGVKGFHELWGFAWRKSTLALNPNVPPINGEQPHIVGPQAFFADTQNNRVLRATWSPIDRSIPPVMTLFTTGSDPWDVVEENEKVYVSFRKEHRIAEFDAATGSHLRDLVFGQPLASVDVNRFVQRLAPLATIQAQPCVAPEGLFVQDGWLYFGSYAMGQVKRVNLVTSAVEVVCTPTIGGNSRFVKISLSDGTFGPRGTVFTSTWENHNFGFPQAFLPGGAEWNWFDYGPMSAGKGGRWDAISYSTSCGAGLGKLLCGSACEGIVQFSKALPTDPTRDEVKYVAGRKQWWAKGYDLVYGEHGIGRCDPLPFGDSPEIDYFLTWNGLTEGTGSPIGSPIDSVGSPIDPIIPPPSNPPGAGMQFTSVTKTAGVPYPQGSDYPPLNVPNQRVEWNMHGSGGGYDTSLPGPSPAYYKGDKYLFTFDSAITGTTQTREVHVSSGGAYGSTLTPPNPVPFISITPIDRVIYPNGRQGETLHSGYRRGSNHIFAAETEDFYLAAINYFKTNLPNVDWTHGISGGTIAGNINNSMGAWAMLRLAMRHPELFAFVGGSSPRFKGSTVKDWETSTDITTPAGQLMDDGSLYADAFDFAQLVNDYTKKLPFLMWTTSTSDGFTPFADCKATIAALRARIRNTSITNDKRSGFACGWVPGAHGAAGPGTTVLNTMNAAYPRDGWKVGQGYPVFDRCSLDADPVTAASGYINKDVKWRNVVETVSGFSCEVGATAACTVEVWPHSEIFLDQITAPITVSIPDAETWMPVSFTSQPAPGPGSPIDDPVIISLTAVPAMCTYGQSSVIDAVVTGAVSLTLDGVLTTLPKTVTPLATHTYTLVATGAAGVQVTATVTVTVTAAPPTLQSLDARLTIVEGRLNAAGIP